MSMRRSAGGSPTSTAVEVVLLPALKNCLVNLPPSLVTLLVNSNTAVQNVVVELSYKSATGSSGGDAGKTKSAAATQSVFFGWTGMQSKHKLSPVVGKDGIRGGTGRHDTEVATIEIDATFGRLLGLSDGVKANVSLHLDPPLAHTVNIEPLTATDWEIIELHSSFLEMNFLSQVRALPNPAFGHIAHPLKLHLTPTSTANVTVTSLTPAPAASQAFVKISPDAEVIVAPKTRAKSRPTSSSRPETGAKDTRSEKSAGKKSTGGRSTTSTVRHKNTHDGLDKSRPPIFLRGVTRKLKNEWFEEDDEEMRDEGLKIWVDRDHLHSKTLRGVTWVTVAVVKPAGLQEPVDPQQMQASNETQPASKLVAKLCVWEDAPDVHHVVLSSLLCTALGADDLVGGIVRVDPAPSPLPRTASALKEPASQQASKDAIVKRLKVTPFAATAAEKRTSGIRFGGESKTEREESALRVKSLFGKTLFDGPLTDGMLLPPRSGWPGGILDFDPAPPGDPSSKRTHWLVGGERKLDVVIQAEAPRSSTAPQWPPGEKLPAEVPTMVGIDAIIEQTRKALLHSSSVLLTGGLGSGKTSLAQLLAHQLRNEYLYNVIYLSCRSLVNDETRVKTIKDTLHRAFASAAWGARLGGRALVVLDDLDKLCPTETELQQDVNGRSRQVAELLCSTVREWCGRDSGVVLLATGQAKEALNNVIIGGHVVRDIVALKAPSKDGRRRVLEMLMQESQQFQTGHAAGNNDTANEWMESSLVESRPSSADGPSHLNNETDLDLLEIAGQTDGYMPGDLALLVSRARSEALIRVITSPSSSSDDVILTSEDFTAALKGFTPASLRGVTLQSSTTTFSAIGGLKETRQTLLETLQYPTTYAPLFAKCPLRLRSGLLLYGFPGCGKTMLASAVAGECGLNFISVKGPEILNKYIGASEKSVRDLFERAEAAKPCVLFFDEFDSIAPKRGHDSTGVTDRVVNMLLTMMDGAEGLSGVYVLAATSRPDLIDPALLRPGRLDKSLICDMPNAEDRLDILMAVSGKLKLDPALQYASATSTQSLNEVAKRTDGYSGADLQAVMYNAHLEAIQDVLGKDAAAQDFGKKKSGDAGRGRANQDFTVFRAGEGKSASGNGVPQIAPAALAAERAQIATKLAAMQLARRKAKAERHVSVSTPTRPTHSFSHVGQMNGAKGLAAVTESADRHEEPIISWRHVVKSLEGTRASISAQERQRLGKIYKEFVVGRNGDMQDGSQGGTEVGGRTSLM